MRVVMVVSHFPQGSEGFIALKFRALNDAGLDAHIYCKRLLREKWSNFTSLESSPELIKRVSVAPPAAAIAVPFHFAVGLIGCLSRPGALLRYGLRGWRRFGWGVLKRFYFDAALVRLAPDILHFEFATLAQPRLYLKDLLGCKITVSFRGFDLNRVSLDRPNFYSRLWKIADRLHFLSDALYAVACNRGSQGEQPIAFIPPAIDGRVFQPRARTQQPVPVDENHPLRILAVGRLVWEKGYEFGFEALALLKQRGVPFHCRLIGDGPYFEALAFARHQLGLEDQIELLGARSAAEVAQAMQWADVFLHPAVSEGFGNVVIEAQAMGLPIVATDAGGLPENVAHRSTGLVVQRRNPAAIAAALANLASRPKKRARMAAAGPARVARYFLLDTHLAKWLAFYRATAEAPTRE